MRTAVLRGRDHTGIGDVAAIAEGRLAIALSRGGAAKTYGHRDPNEDAVAFATAGGGDLLLIADGHGGAEAAEQALEHLLAAHAGCWTAADTEGLRERWEDLAPAALFETGRAVVGHATRAGVPTTRTTLVVCLVREREGWLGWASMGDSHLFHVATSGEVVDLLDRPDSASFLGHPAETQQTLRAKCVTGTEPLTGTRALVLATDGISERGIGVDVPETTVAECAARAQRDGDALRPLRTARGLVEAALEAHRLRRAGDNVASAVLWVEGSEVPQQAGHALRDGAGGGESR